MPFFGITVSFIVQKMKTKQIVYLSFLWWQVFLREWEKASLFDITERQILQGNDLADAS